MLSPHLIIEHANNDITNAEHCADIQGLAIPQNAERNETTMFADEAGVCTTAPYEQRTSFISSISEFQDLKAFLGRPILAERGALATSSSVLYLNEITWNTLSTIIPNFALRLSGVQGIRFTLCAKVEHNANSFHQGLLHLGFQYGAPLVASNTYLRGSNPSSCTMLPGVRLNISENTSCQLSVPFVAEFDYMSRDTSIKGEPLGVLNLTQVLATPTLASSGSPVYKLYIWLEDVELIQATTLTDPVYVVPQSGLSNKSVLTKEKEETRTISPFLDSAATTVGKLQNMIPSLAPLTGPTKWFLGCAAKAAHAFGFSKPLDATKPERMIPLRVFYDNHVDMPTPSLSITPFQTNSLVVDATMGGTMDDEMSFEYVLSKYSQLFRGNLTTTDSHGAILWATNHNLNYYWFKESTARPAGNTWYPEVGNSYAAIIQPTIINYVSQHFRFWRGDVKYRITFAKSKFHAGRVMLTYIPDYRKGNNYQPANTLTTNTVPTPPSYLGDVQVSSYSKIFDLRDSAEFEFIVPYVAPVQYSGVNDALGGISMVVIDPLIANGEASTTVDFMVELCALPNFSFAHVTAPTIPIVGNHASFVQQQSGLDTTGLGADAEISTDRDPSMYTMGEKFLSLKQLAMIPCYTKLSIDSGTINSTSLAPWWWYPAWGNTSPLPLTWTPPGAGAPVPNARTIACPRAGHVAACYAFVGGPTQHYLLADRDIASEASVGYLSSDGGNLQTSSDYTNNPYFKNFYSAVKTLSSTHVSLPFTVPSFQTTSRISLGESGMDKTIYRDYNYGSQSNFAIPNPLTYRAVGVLNVRNNSGGTLGAYHSFCAGDEARATNFIGVPPLHTGNFTGGNFAWQNSRTIV